jgi:hypothetical protein
MVERFPEEVIQSGWEELTRAEDFGEPCRMNASASLRINSVMPS